MSKSKYSLLDKALHRFSLHFESIAEMCFDLDQSMVKIDVDEIVRERHIFISGLARAGTTVLLRRFYASGLYRSLTYRDMPFVLAPNLWRRLSSISKRQIDDAERAHGDRLVVNADSPESFDEVFWRIFAGDEYLYRDRLTPHSPSTDVVNRYVRYVCAILAAQTTHKTRYLSKNNNNILRLGAIHAAFPDALILVPFRHPLQHAYSLLRQHRRFLELQAEDKFVLNYMTWLGHHEFGGDHRPFVFGDRRQGQYSEADLNYWLQLWLRTYSWLETAAPQSALFVCYEDICTRDDSWDRLAQAADLPSVNDVDMRFRLSEQTIDAEVDSSLVDSASLVYARLIDRSRSVPTTTSDELT